MFAVATIAILIAMLLALGRALLGPTLLFYLLRYSDF